MSKIDSYRIHEAIAALTGDFFHDHKGFDKFHKRHADRIGGIAGIWNVLIDAAKVFEKVCQKYGEPGEDFDWMLAITNFATMLHSAEYLDDSEYEKLAHEAIKAEVYKPCRTK